MFLAYFKILKKRNFIFLWLGQIISQFGDRLTQIALIGYASNVYKSSSSLAFIISITIVPSLLFSPISGVYIDRWSKRKTMYVCDFLRGIFILLIPLYFLKLQSLMFIGILIFLSFSVGRFFIPAKMAFVPQIIEKQDIFLANSLITVTATIAAIFGIGLGGILVDSYGVKNAFAIDATTFFISALAIFFISTKERGKFLVGDILHIGKDAVDTVKKSFMWEFKEGIKYIFALDEARYAFRVFFFLFSYIGGLSTVFMRFIQNTLGSLTKDLGLIAASLGLGIFVGSLVYGRVAHKFSVTKVINFSTLFASLFLILFTVSIKVYPYSLYAIFLSFILGLIISPIFVGVNSLIHKKSDSQLLGRIFSGLEFTSHLGLLISMFTFAFLADIFGFFRIIISIGIIGSIFSLISIVRDDKVRRA